MNTLFFKDHAELRLRFFVDPNHNCHLDYQYLVPDWKAAKCELRDVIFSFARALFLQKSVRAF
jgi:hypothetical protein